jgi:multidrug resistance efflux pump
MILRKLAVPALSLAGLALAVWTVATGSPRVAAAPPVAEPASSPYPTKIAGAGLVEAASENVAVGAPVSGIVAKVLVEQGQRVEAGALLVLLDPRQRTAERDVRAADAAAAQAELARLVALPRPEDLPPAEAAVAAARASFDEASELLALAEGVHDPRAVSTEELARRRAARAASAARLQGAEAEFARLAAGAFEPEIELARARAAAAALALAAAEVELERLEVRAPIAGTVLQIDVRPGEYAESTARGGLLVLGDTTRLHVRVDLDESDAWRFTPGAVARAFVRGNPKLATELAFVRVNPYVIPKRSLTGDSTERVDTRVLQVLYAFDSAALPVFVGQQMDVYIEARSSEIEAR